MSDFAKAYAQLISLKQNLPNAGEVTTRWVDDFHSILETVERETGEDLKAFRVPHDDIHRQRISVRRGTRRAPGSVTYGSNMVVSRSRLILKVDAILGYFQMQFQPQPPPDKQSIGFRKA
jgi:sulfate adenylyltransferase subunit 1 (EFTu-like GTPase family)